jgi:hypothetical protein
METAHEVLDMVQSVAKNIDNMESADDNEKMIIFNGFLASIKKENKSTQEQGLIISCLLNQKAVC